MINQFQPFQQAQAPNIGAQFAELGQIIGQQRQAQAKQQQEEETSKRFSTDIQTWGQDPTPQGLVTIMARYPGMAKAFEPLLTSVTAEQKENEFRSGFEILNAIENKNFDVAEQLLDARITAGKNSGKPTATYENIRNQLRENPVVAQANASLYLGMLEPKRFKDVVDARIASKTEGTKIASEEAAKDKAVSDAKKAVSEATTAQATAATAEQKAKADADKAKADAQLTAAQAAKAKVEAEFAKEKTQADLKQAAATLRKTDADILINKENARIAALNAAAAKELNAVKREEILQRREEATEKRDQAKRDQDSLLGNQLSSIDNFLNTAIRATNTPLDVREAATGPVSARFIPTLRQATADFEGLIETLGAQAFLAQIPQIKGTGSLSENEGNKLQASLQNLSLKQSPERLQENINEAVRLLTKARANIATRSGKAVAPPDTPAASEFLVKLPNGQTAKFPNQAAADLFKKQAGIK